MKTINLRLNISHQFFQKIIEDSVLTQQVYLQNKLNEQRSQNLHIAFLGKRGSYSNLAARNYAARYQKQFIELGCQSFEQVFEKVQNGEAEFWYPSFRKYYFGCD